MKDGEKCTNAMESKWGVILAANIANDGAKAYKPGKKGWFGHSKSNVWGKKAEGGAREQRSSDEVKGGRG